MIEEVLLQLAAYNAHSPTRNLMQLSQSPNVLQMLGKPHHIADKRCLGGATAIVKPELPDMVPRLRVVGLEPVLKLLLSGDRKRAELLPDCRGKRFIKRALNVAQCL